MKEVNTILAIILLTMTGCGSNEQSANTLIMVDVTANYPKKELVLQDFMDVEYIPLETTNEFLCQGLVQAIGKEIILVKNQVNDGNIYVYNRAGKGLRIINRFGRGSEEYSFLAGIFLDEDNGEIFINDISPQRILVYDLYGRFKRSLPVREDARYRSIYGFGTDNLIFWDASYQMAGETTTSRFFTPKPDGETPFLIISKQDGSIVKEIQIPHKGWKSTAVIQQDERGVTVMPIVHFPVIPYQDGWILSEPSADTVFKYSSDHSMIPFIGRTPSIHSTTPEIFLIPLILTDHYFFMKTEKKEFDFAAWKGLPKTYLMYDRQEEKIYEYTVYNDDYSNETIIDMAQATISNEIAFWKKIEADELVESYKKGELKGKLKEVAADLEEDSNPVIMLVKHKK